MTTEIAVPMDKFPRLKSLTEQVSNIALLIDCYKMRNKILNEKIKSIENSESETAFKVLESYNELQIATLETTAKLANQYTALYAKQQNIKDYREKIINPYFDEIATEYDVVVEKAKALAETDEAMKQVVGSTDFVFLETNWEYKFDFYIRAKNYMNAPKPDTNSKSTMSVVEN